MKKVEALPATSLRARLGLAQIVVALAGALYVLSGAALLLWVGCQRFHEPDALFLNRWFSECNDAPS